MAGEEADRRPLLGAPQPDSLVCGAGGQVVGVGVEFDTVHVGKMPGVDAQRVSAGKRPEAGRAVVGSAGEVKAAGADVHVPHWVGVALVEHRVGEATQVPVADGRVLRAGEQAGAVCQEGGPKHRAAVTSQRLYLAAEAVFFIRLRRNNRLFINLLIIFLVCCFVRKISKKFDKNVHHSFLKIDIVKCLVSSNQLSKT